MLNPENIYKKALNREFLSVDEALFLYENVTSSDLIFIANQVKKDILKEKSKNVTWLIDRNVNITNVCIAQCKFCNFHRSPKDADIYITTRKEYEEKIKVLKEHGGNQLLLQGGLHPKLGLEFYCNLFKELKDIEPEIKLHALGPPEIYHIARIEKTSYENVLQQLIDSGLDSLPGAGAEILVDRVRKYLSPGKCSSQQWLDVMRVAHKLNMTTSATMMFGHIETKAERMEHLIKIRNLQEEKPENSVGFIAFIPWIFMDEGTVLSKKTGVRQNISSEEYIKTIAISRIMLPNIENIQASWLTVGKSTGQMCLHAGANDFGSIMIEENVVSAAGANNSFDTNGIQNAIREAGFIPKLRNQNYRYL